MEPSNKMLTFVNGIIFKFNSLDLNFSINFFFKRSLYSLKNKTQNLKYSTKTKKKSLGTGLI